MATAIEGTAVRGFEAGRVLVVDDEIEVRRMVVRCLKRAGFVTAEAGNGETALRLLREQTFDLLISDVQMPVMNGLELLEAVQSECPAVPVVLVTGSLEVQDAPMARALGAFGLLKKPFSITELQRTARRATRGVDEDERDAAVQAQI